MPEYFSIYERINSLDHLPYILIVSLPARSGRDNAKRRAWPSQVS